jgi:DNA-binding NtrC family response regulator
MGEHIRILVVDDDESIRTVLAAVLEEKGYAVDTVGCGKEAIEKTKTNFYNVAFIDIRLPDMEGTKVLAEMQNTAPKIRKIMITGYPSLQNAVEALRKGAHAYIMKPFDMAEMLTTVEEQLKKQEEEKKYDVDKVTEFIETRVKELVEEGAAKQNKPR